MDKIYQWRRRLKLDKVQLTYRSLIRMSLGIILFFIVAGFIATSLFPSNNPSRFLQLSASDYQSAEQELSEYLTENPESEDHWRTLVQMRFYHMQISDVVADDGIIDFQELQPQVRQKSHLTSEQFWALLHKAKKPTPAALKLRFLYLTSKGKNPELLFKGPLSVDERHELTLMYFESGRFKKAGQLALELIEENYREKEMRRLYLSSLTYSKNFEVLEQRLSDKEWVPFASNNLLYKFHFEKRNYPQIFYYLILSEYDFYSWKAIAVCLVAGLGWALFMIHLGAGWGWSRFTLLKALAAVVLGMVSAMLCLFVVVLQNDWIDYHNQEKTLIYNLAYCIFGIGLREEVCKLLLFCPILLWLRKESSSCRILIFASLVGLGFAIEENFSYISRAGGDPGALMARFMTANFLHMLMTGYIGYYFTVAVQRRGRYWDDFTSAFIKMVLCHGVYDFLLIDQNMVEEGMDFFAMMLYIWVAMQYLRLIIQVTPPSHRYVSLSRFFTVVLSITFGLSLFFVAMDLGVVLALQSSLLAIVGNVFFAYMFYYEFNEVVH